MKCPGVLVRTVAIQEHRTWSAASQWLNPRAAELVPVRGYAEGCSAEHVEFVGIAA
jgi:hypothetical protein